MAKEYKTRPLAERFWAKVQKTTGCWLWMGAKLSPKGYGVIGRDKGKGRTVLAHRMSYILAHGDIPEGLWVLHSCDNRQCVRPTHLFLGTAAVNTADMVSKNRHAFGEGQPTSKLKTKQIRDIKLAAKNGTRNFVLAKKYGVSSSTICMIKSGKRWKHIEV